MSADLVLMAAPDEEWLKVFDRIQRATFTTSDDEGYERDEEGYLYEPEVDARLAEMGYGPERGLTFEESAALRDQLEIAEHIWIGQVSWLKGGLLGEPYRYVPEAVMRVAQLVDDGKVLTPGLAKAITVAMNLPNISIYGKRQVVRLPVRNYNEVAQGYRKKRERPFLPTPIGHRRVVYRKPEHGHDYVGLQRRQILKHWLERHLGQTIVQESW